MALSDWNGFVGAARHLTEDEIAAAAKGIDVKWSRLHGVMEVEAAWRKPGDGYDGKSRPKMLFEPHLFYRELKDEPAKQGKAVRGRLAYEKWRAGSYPGESYTRLSGAMLIDEEAALRAASWGLGQVLGSNCRICGFEDAADMVRQMMDAELAQLQAMTGFIKANRIVDEMQRGDAPGFARVYNGKGFRRHGYHTKLDAAWAKWAKREFVTTAVKQ